MTLEDLEYFFERQLQRGETTLVFTVSEPIDGETRITVLKHDLTLYPLDDLIYLLDNCLYFGSESGVPRFTK